MDLQNIKFFTDLEPNKDIKIGICPLVGKISNKLYSHKGAWDVMLCNQLITAGYKNSNVIYDQNENWSSYDVILIEHGMEYKGTFNVFGGASDELARQVLRIFSSARMYSVHHDMPDVGAFIQSRLKHGTELFKSLEPRVSDFTIASTRIPRIDYIAKTDGQVFGDSHSFSLYEPGYTCTRYDGLTMYGMLNKGLGTYIFPWTKKLKVYIGNIDIRHHLMRQQDPLASINKMVSDLEEQIKSLNISEVIIRHTLPIEDESRKIPKSGFYKKLPFFGSRDERAALSVYMNRCIDEVCYKNNWTVYKNPNCYFDKDHKLPFEVMERPQSVHISREYHYWDYENNIINTRVL